MSVLEKVRKMREAYAGVKIGSGSVRAIILISMRLKGKEKKKELEIAKEISKIPFVKKAWVVAGEWDIALLVESDMATLSDFVLKKLRDIEEVEKTKTIFIFEEFS